MKNVFDFPSHYQRVKTWYKTYERFLMPAVLIGSFLFDYITFANIAIKDTFLLLLFYWIIVTLAIFLECWQPTKPLPAWLNYLKLFSPLIVQFCFGGLLRFSLIFYWFSGALSVSWPIIIFITLLMIANELFKDYFANPMVQTAIHFFGTFSLLTVFFPYAFNMLSPWLFVLAGASTLGIFALFLYGLFSIAKVSHMEKYWLFGTLVIIFVSFNALYFFNIIPPIPLSLKEAGLYHSLEISGGKYAMKGEIETFWQQWQKQTLHVKAGEKIYCYTAIFAPADLKTKIVHHWQYYDQKKKTWIDKGVFSFNISGGAEKGYKGYTWNSNLSAGSWRIFVENGQKQVLGKIDFTVETTTQAVKLQKIIR